MAILLLGSTGNGKSTLGNFLIDPDSTSLPPDQKFAVARNNMPTTEVCQVVPSCIESKDTKVIDTPGLNESKSKDLWHMINIIERIQEVQEIRACIFVVKFSAHLDAQYKTTVEYYSSLLPDLFENNVVIVVTNYPTDTRSVQMRKRQEIDPSEITRNIRNTIVQDARLSFDPLLFMLDCDPFDEEEMKTSKGVRKDLLQYIFSLKVAEVKDFTVAKTPALLEEDGRIVSRCEGEIEGYKVKLQQADMKAELALNKVQSLQRTVTRCNFQLTALRGDVKELDTEKPVTSTVYSVDDTWKFLRWLTKPFEIESNHQIHSYSTWSNGKCKFVDVNQDSHKVTGRIEGRFMRGLYASVTVYTKKKWVHAKEIEDLKKKIAEKESERDIAIDKAKQAKSDHDMHKEQVSELQGYIEEKNEIILKLAPKRLSLEEARQRLQELRSYKK